MGSVQAAIEARAVSYRTRAGEVTVRDVSLTVGQGELVAIIGGSGSGKATLLDAMSGLRPPTSGTVLRHVPGDARQAGGPPPGRSVRPAAVTRSHPVLPLARALRYTAALRGVHATPARRSSDALGMVGLAAEAAVPVGALDPGERKRAAIAAELLAGPAQLFLDEPTAGLDPAQATEVLRLLRRLSRGGMTVLLTTSSPLDAARCDKVAVLATGGHLAFFGTPAAARGYFGADSLEEIYERLAGLGDPAAAWSRRFFHFSRTRAGFTQVPTTPRAPGPAVLVPDAAGPHSAGRPGLTFPRRSPPPGTTPTWRRRTQAAVRGPRAGGARPRPARAGAAAAPAAAAAARPDQAQRRGARPGPAHAGHPGGRARRRPAGVLRAARGGRARRSRRGDAGLGGARRPGRRPGLRAARRRTESGVLRGERFSGLSTAAFALAKAAVLLPVLAVADALILAVPAIAGRLQAGFGLGVPGRC